MKHQRTTGFSLLELLISIALSSIVLSALIVIYLGSKNVNQTIEQLNTQQENLRFASIILQQNVSIAGYCGCRKINEVALYNNTGFAFSLVNSVRGFDEQHLPPYLRGMVLPKTEVLIIQQAASDVTRVIAPVIAGSSSVQVRQNPAHKENLVLLISDCMHAELFIAKNWIGNTVFASTPFKNSYAAGVTEVGRFEEIAYFIADSGRLDARGQHINSLYCMINQGNKQELLADINSMQLSYGIAEPGSKLVTKYYTTSAMQGKNLWEQVRSVKLTLRLANNKSFDFYVALRER